MGPDRRRLRIRAGKEELSFLEALRLWQENEAFGRFFSQQLAVMPYAAFFWECPPLRAEEERPFECMCINSPALARVAAAPRSFAGYFGGATPILRFPNLRGDATLVVPQPLTAATAYPHLATFLRAAPPHQQLALWREAGQAFEAALGAAPRWLSTSGLGVHWLHLRIDQRPKYYQHAPYREG